MVVMVVLSVTMLQHFGVAANAIENATVVDLKTNITGPSNALPKEAFTYTVSVDNNQVSDAAGSTVSVQLPESVTDLQVDCVAANGAQCPTDLDVGGSGASGVFPVLPHLGTVTITLTGHFGAASPSSVTATSTVTVPEGVTESDPSTNFASINTIMNVSVDVSTTVVAESSEAQMGEPVRFRATVTNAGPAPADGSLMRLSSGKGQVKVISCTGEGMECPAHIADGTVSNSGTLWTRTLGTFPAQASFTVVYDIVVPDGCGAYKTFMQSEISAPSHLVDTDLKNNTSSAAGVPVVQPACPEKAHLTVSKTQEQELLTPESPKNVYTVTVRNDGAVPAEQVNFIDQMSFSKVTAASVRILDCDFGGGNCPPGIVDREISVESWSRAWGVVLGTLDPGAELKVTYELNIETAECGTGSVTNQAAANASGLNSPTTSVKASVEAGPCPSTDLAANISASTSSFTPDTPTTYTAEYSNRGPTDADGARINLGSNTGAELAADVRVVSCVAEAGAECPDVNQASRVLKRGPNASMDVVPWRTVVPQFPVGSKVTIVYTVEPKLDVCVNRTLDFSAAITSTDSVADTDSSNNHQVSKSQLSCVDLAISMDISPNVVSAGDDVEFTIRVSNSGSSAAKNALFELPLPAGFVFETSECAPGTLSTCGEIHFDEETGKISSQIPLLSGGRDFIEITLRGTAGPVMATYTATGTVESGPDADAVYDINMGSNKTTQTYQVFNTRSDVEITKTLTGLGEAGAPVDLTFTGIVTCSNQDPIPWEITIPAGQSSASLPAFKIWDNDDCVVTEDPASFELDPWYSVDTAELSNTDLGSREPNESISVTSTSPVQFIPGPVSGDDAAETETGVAVEIPLLTNDDGSEITIVSVTETPDGSVTVNENGSIEFTPAPDFVGTATFTYTIADQFGRESTATVTVVVLPLDVSTGPGPGSTPDEQPAPGDADPKPGTEDTDPKPEPDHTGPASDKDPAPKRTGNAADASQSSENPSSVSPETTHAALATTGGPPTRGFIGGAALLLFVGLLCFATRKRTRRQHS